MSKLKSELLNAFSPVMKRLYVPIGQLSHFRKFHRFIKMRDPVLFYDKVAWIMRNGDLTMLAQLTDKYAVRDFVAAICGNDILTTLYGVYDSAAQIDFDELPDRFVVKTNNGCASNFFVRDRSKDDLEQIRDELAFWLKIDYGAITCQPHYSLIQPRIIAEQLLIEDGNPAKVLTDYKFHCFDGMVHNCAAFRDRVTGTHEFARMVYDTQWNPHPEWIEPGRHHLGETPRPSCLDEMIHIASNLSRGFAFVRVDLYCIDGRPKFGEMTFAPGLAYYTLDFQRMMGDLIDLDKVPLRTSSTPNQL